jgi:hypothetical protein
MVVELEKRLIRLAILQPLHAPVAILTVPPWLCSGLPHRVAQGLHGLLAARDHAQDHLLPHVQQGQGPPGTDHIDDDHGGEDWRLTTTKGWR